MCPCPARPTAYMRTMPDLTKIATCCYCGTRAVLKLGGTTAHHELRCRSCGAKLHHMKRLRAERPDRPAARRVAAMPYPQKPKKTRKPGKTRRKRRAWLADLFEEVGDLVEDIFD